MMKSVSPRVIDFLALVSQRLASKLRRLTALLPAQAHAAHSTRLPAMFSLHGMLSRLLLFLSRLAAALLPSSVARLLPSPRLLVLAARVLTYALRAVAIAEAGFYLYFRHRLRALDRRTVPEDVPPTPAMRRAHIRRLFDDVLHSGHCPILFIREWFHGAEFKDIRHQNLREWCAGAFLNKELWECSRAEIREADDVVAYIEAQTGLRPRAGYNSAVKCLKFNLDPLRVRHRPLLVYGVIAAARLLVGEPMMRALGFRRLEVGGMRYWYRPGSEEDLREGGDAGGDAHEYGQYEPEEVSAAVRAEDRRIARGLRREDPRALALPVWRRRAALRRVECPAGASAGVGCDHDGGHGVYGYHSSHQSDDDDDDEEEEAKEVDGGPARTWAESVEAAEAAPGAIVFCHGIGVGVWTYLHLLRLLGARYPRKAVFLPETPLVSMRLHEHAFSARQAVARLGWMLRRHGHAAAAWAGHSYGTFTVGHCLRYARGMVRSVALADPVCFLIHRLDGPFQFLLARPRTAHARLLRCVAQTELGVVHALKRRLWWYQSGLWPEQLPPSSAVMLASRDAIVPAEGVRSTVAGRARVLWLPGLAHAGFVGRHDATHLLLDCLAQHDHRDGEPASKRNHCRRDCPAAGVGEEKSTVLGEKCTTGYWADRLHLRDLDEGGAADAETAVASDEDPGCGEPDGEPEVETFSLIRRRPGVAGDKSRCGPPPRPISLMRVPSRGDVPAEERNKRVDDCYLTLDYER
jgi:hypothetical protein